jgi:hypothetical protein
MKRLLAVLALAASLGLAGCDSEGKSGPVVILQKQSMFCDSALPNAPTGSECWQDVASLYGYDDDWEGCEEIRAALKEHPTSENAVYRCVPK